MYNLTTIWMKLLDEGTDVWRPVPAIKISDNDVFVIVRPSDYDTAEELWEFPPGSIVYGNTRQLSGASMKVEEKIVACELLGVPPLYP